MKYRVVGWTYYDDDRVEDGALTWAARVAILDEIKRNGYEFSGWDHQEEYNCVPVLNDGKKRTYSQRGWGDVMAEAHGETDSFAYVGFAFDAVSETRKIPENEYRCDEFTSETDLNEVFELPVSAEQEQKAKQGRIALYDFADIRYLDGGDTLVLKSGDQSAVYDVVEVVRKINGEGKQFLDVTLKEKI